MRFLFEIMYNYSQTNKIQNVSQHTQTEFLYHKTYTLYNIIW